MISKVLLVDDDAHVREALGQTLALAELNPTLCASFIEAKDHINAGYEGVILSDIRMPGKDGFHLLEYAQKCDPDLPVILLTGEGDIPMAVRGISAGAFDFLEKPCAPADLVSAIEKALKTRELVLDNRRMKAQLEKGDAADRLIFGTSELVKDMRARVRAVARTHAEVLITGEPGTGISKVAEVIHLVSSMAMNPFKKAAAAGLKESEFKSLLRDTETGTLFLDEVAALPPAVQFSLLQHLETGDGARIIAGTYRDLQKEASEGRFNPDLYYKLDVMRIRVPSLRERSEDIPVLFRHYVAIACEQAALPLPDVTPELVSRLMAQDWPGNARSLMNAAMRFALALGDDVEEDAVGLAEQMAKYERSLLVEALQRENGNASEAARRLKLPRKTFYDKLGKYEIRADTYRQ
ncbi:sigma-54 dependent transcriptional regulator [Halocynthiibacter sp. C4]|uniref:sigma-54-dependent transcriptional regulator n=1 Tax=Halocynthiibacter sp. C4 TaxID=2992758 RepID=UPI00237AFF0A|nr:sigma-54 dependent transcriptional regulator [Halocynthiibacter sp. C4]MDE0589327.1 sigma-54 dependent transcriptional regulator [Halocynthiibacter sp. C4]